MQTFMTMIFTLIPASHLCLQAYTLQEPSPLSEPYCDEQIASVRRRARTSIHINNTSPRRRLQSNMRLLPEKMSRLLPMIPRYSLSQKRFLWQPLREQDLLAYSETKTPGYEGKDQTLPHSGYVRLSLLCHVQRVEMFLDPYCIEGVAYQ
jgi:hypothetical protein